MRNKHRQRCSDCGLWVEPGQGEAVLVDGKWNVAHDDCEDAEEPEATDERFRNNGQ